MSYVNYFMTFSKAGTEQFIADAHYKGVIPAVVNERLMRVMGNIDKLPRSAVNTYPQLNYDQIARCLVYELFRLDVKKFFLRKGVRNTSLSPIDLMDAIEKIDHRMISTTDLDLLQSLVSVTICVAVLYAHKLNKKVEVRKLLAYDDRQIKTVLITNLVNAQEELTDIRHFNRNKYDKTIMSFLIVKKPAVKARPDEKPKRAF